MTVLLRGLMVGLLILLALLAWEFGQSPHSPAVKPQLFRSGTALPLIDALDSAIIDGQASAAIDSKREQRVVFQQDFEGSDAATAYVTITNPRPATGAAQRRIGSTFTGIVSLPVAAGPDSKDSSHVLELRGPYRGSLGVHLKPLPVTPGKFYRLSYRVATDRTADLHGTKVGGVDVFGLKLVRGGAGKRGRFSFEKKSLGLSPPYFPGSTGWQEVHQDFFVGPTTTKILIELYHTWYPEAASNISLKGKVWFDSIKLYEIDESPHKALSTGLSPRINFHPLATGVKMRHPPETRAFSHREAIYTPAPSEVTFPVQLGTAPVLSFRCGILDVPLDLAHSTPIQYRVLVQDALKRDGGTEKAVVFSTQLDSSAFNDRSWKLEQVDLSAFAGKKVYLTLQTTQPDPEDSGAAATIPAGSYAAWVNPILSDNDRSGKNIVLILIDTVSAFRTSMHSYKRSLTPNLERLSSSGILYENAYASSSWTLPSFGSILTGLPYARHRAGETIRNTLANHGPLAPDVTSFVEVLRKRGWITRGWINNPNMRPAHNVDQGFMNYHYYYAVHEQNAAEQGVTAFMDRFKERSAANRFFLLHLLDPHVPYYPPDDFARRYVDKCSSAASDPLPCTLSARTPHYEPSKWDSEGDYRIFQEQLHEATMAYSDQQIGRVLDYFSSAQAPEDTLVIVSADHGEEFWEHERWEHGHSLYDEIIHVPMIVKSSDSIPTRSKKVVSIEDIPHTILEFAGLSASEIAGSCCSLLNSKSIPDRDIIIGGMLYGPHRQAVVNDEWKYVYNSLDFATNHPRVLKSGARYELYDRAKLDSEHDNLFYSHTEVAARLHDKLVEGSLPWFKGSYLVVFRSGDERAARIKLLAELPEKGRWKSDVKDLIRPLTGKQSPPRFTKRSVGNNGGKGLAISLQAAQAFLGLETTYPASSPVQFTLKEQPDRSDPVRVLLGCKGEQAAADTFLLSPAKHRVNTTAELSGCLKNTSAATPSILIVYFGDLQSPSTADVSGSLNADSRTELEAELESLGYAQ